MKLNEVETENIILEAIEKKASDSIREYVYKVVRKNIISLNLKPGQSVNEKEIGEILNASRTPVREAFIRLVQEELLDVYPQKGTYVSLIDLSHVEEARFMRENLEKATVKLACQHFSKEYLFQLQSNLNMQQFCVDEKNYTKIFNLDEEFHKTIFKGCNKTRIYMLIQQMNSHFNRIRILNLASDYHWDEILSHHQEIVEAIKNKDGARAEKVMEKHLKKVIFDQEILKQEYPSYFKK